MTYTVTENDGTKWKGLLTVSGKNLAKNWRSKDTVKFKTCEFDTDDVKQIDAEE